MAQLCVAWILYTKKAGKEIGFMRAGDFRKRFKEYDLTPPS